MKITLNKILKVMCIGIILGISNSAFATLVTLPEGLAPGGQYRLVFVTAATHDASSNDITVYNDFITSQVAGSALLTALGSNWSVLGSTPNVDAMDNTNTNPVSAGVPIYNLNGQLVASGNADLWDGSLANPINVGQNGNVAAKAVFTGTAVNGVGLNDRQLGANGFRVQYGNSGSTNANWTTIDWSGTLNGLYFYGISGVLPEPCSLVVLGLGGLMLRKRRA